MRWLAKIAAFRVLSIIPGGARLYRLAQERVTGSLVTTRARVNLKIEVGLRYWAWLEANAVLPVGGAHLDFGAGWHPSIPLLYHALGVERQWLFDLNPLLQATLLAETCAMVARIVEDPAWPERSRLRRPILAAPTSGAAWREALRAGGIEYHAPYAKAWPIVAGQADFVTSTQVLLHIPRAVLAEIFAHIFASLKPGGHFLATIHLRDLHATPENGLPPHNHLKYSPWVWENLVNTTLMPYNRLKAPDYRALLEAVGFQIRGWEVDPATPEELAAFDRTPVHPCFAGYSREDLSARHLFFAAQKPA
jgi:SAM-dependent methyltransferase